MKKQYRHFRTPYIDIDNYEFEKEEVKLIPEAMARCHKTILMSNTNNIFVLVIDKDENDELEQILSHRFNAPILFVKSDTDKIVNAINANY